MSASRLLRRAAARTLSGMSAALSVAAKLNEVGARLLDPDGRPAPARTEHEAASSEPEAQTSRIEDLFSEAAEDVTEVTDRVSDTLRREQAPPPPPPTEPSAPTGFEPAPPVKPASQPSPGSSPRSAPAPSPTAPPVAQPADVPATDEDHLRTAESHVANLAQRTVAAIQAAIPNLSTDELEALYDYEQAHRNRKTVLAAIERSLAPDVERVYSTETGEG